MRSIGLTVRGFTLVEMLVSMAVGMMLLLVSAALLDQTGNGYERVGGGIAAEREARAALTQLAADLASARDLGNSVFFVGDESWRTDRLAFLTLQPRDAQSEEGRIGDLCAVHYYVKDLPIADRTVRCLVRGFRESGETFEALRTGTIESLFEPRELDEPLAFNVASFVARPMVLGLSGSWTDWTASEGRAPARVEVRLVIARRELAAKLVDSADWNGGGRHGHLLGNPAEATQNRQFDVFETTFRFGHHEAP